MRRHAAVFLLACAACAPRTTMTRVSVEQVHGATGFPGTLASFVAAVAPFEEGGECRSDRDEGGGRTVVLRYPGPDRTARNVALTFDAGGKLLRYSDVRGDLRLDGTGPRTMVTMGFDVGTSTAMNVNGGAAGTPGLATGSVDEAMELQSLGMPRRMIEVVRRRCMGARD